MIDGKSLERFDMQLRSVQINEEGFKTKIQIAAALDQWIELCGLTTDEWMKEFDGDVFRFIKWMNERIKVDVIPKETTDK